MPVRLKIGAAERIITPPVGTSLAGYFHDRKSTAVRDDLLAKAVVADDGENVVALIACDLIGIPDELSRAARRLIRRRVGIPEGNIMISATHTHTGPEVRAGRMVPRNDEWFAEAPGLLAAAACEAFERRRPARLWLGRGQEEGLAFNRRFRMEDCSEQFGTSEDPRSVLGPAGPTDPELGVIKITRGRRDPFAVIVNYTLHIDVMGGVEISADYPGHITEVVRAVYGPDTICLFINGATGDINHVDYSGKSPWPRKGPAKSTQIGRALGGHAVNIAEKAYPGKSREVGAARELLKIPYHPVTPELQQWERELRRKPKKKLTTNEERFLRGIAAWDKDGQVADVEVQAVRLGDAVFVGLPGEPFCVWGFELKKWSPFPYTFIAEQSNQSHGYIATWEAVGRGGYEAIPFVGTHLARGAGQTMVDAAFKLVRSLA